MLFKRKLVKKRIEFTRVQSDRSCCELCKFFLHTDELNPIKLCAYFKIDLDEFLYDNNVMTLCKVENKFRSHLYINFLNTSNKYVPEKINCLSKDQISVINRITK